MVTAMQAIKAFCFDLDGLMVDSEPLHFEAQRRVMERRGKPYTLEDKLAVTGGVVRASVQKAADQYGLGDVDQMYRERASHFQQLAGDSLKLQPGLADLLRRLKSRRVKCAVVTSGEREYVDWTLDHFRIGRYIAATVSAEDCHRHKPDAEPYLKAAGALETAPEHCLALEDSRTGLLSANAAGTYAIVIPTTLTMHQDFALADGLLDSLEDIDDAFLNRILDQSS